MARRNGKSRTLHIIKAPKRTTVRVTRLGARRGRRM